MDGDLRCAATRSGDPRWLRCLCRGGLLRGRKPACPRQRDAPRSAGRRETGDLALGHARMAARLGSPRNLRCSDGHREKPLRGVCHRRRVRVHHGARCAGHKISRVRDSRCGCSSQVTSRGRSSFRPFSIHFGKAERETAVSAELILHNAKIATNGVPSFVEAIAITAGRIAAAGKDEEILRLRGPHTRVIDGRRRTVIPGLNDSHMHPIRGGLNYNLELRWDGVPSLADALRMLKEQAARTPAPQWVRVIGGWTEFQFAERRMPTLDEINAVAPDTPVFVMHLYDRALLNGAALRAVGYDKNAPDFPAGEVQRDRHGNPTGLLIAKPNANILYSTLAKGPKLSREDQLNSSRLFFRELNRFGITSAIDAGGGFQNYPDDYGVVSELHKKGELSIRLAYNLFTQRPKQELADFQSWTKMTKPGDGDDFYRVNAAEEMLVFSAADFEDFLVLRPDLL